MSYGMIGYIVPLSVYPKGYRCDPTLPLPFVNLGSQKNFIIPFDDVEMIEIVDTE
jgi:hypothetical protein